MKLVIDIPEDVYTRLFDNGIQDNEISVDDVCEMARALRLGKPLPLIEDVDNCDSQYAINVKNQWSTIFKEEGAE